MPVNPLPGSRAYFQCLLEQDWTLRIERGGVPLETLEDLRPTDISYEATRNVSTGPLPWWCLSPELIAAAHRHQRKQPTNSPFVSASA